MEDGPAGRAVGRRKPLDPVSLHFLLKSRLLFEGEAVVEEEAKIDRMLRHRIAEIAFANAKAIINRHKFRMGETPDERRGVRTHHCVDFAPLN